MTTLQVKQGDIIRAYDFKPMVGREDCFIEGEVLETNNTNNGYPAYKIRVTKDVFDGVNLKGDHGIRVSQIMFVPWKVSFSEFQGRIMNLSQ